MAKAYQLVLLAIATVASADSIKPSNLTKDPDSPILCGPVCAIYCQYGNVLDARGCPTCQCKPKPPCPRVNCSYSCPYGYQVDANDCKTCKCNCPIIDCARCPPPKVTRVITNSTTGCSIGCSCDCPPRPLCVRCPYGSYPDTSDDCPTCPRCRPKPPCPSVNCSHSCPMGYLVDSNGCKTCKCNCSSINSAVNCSCQSPKTPHIIRNAVTGCASVCKCVCPAANCSTCPRPQLSVPIRNPNTSCITGCSCRCPPLPTCPACRYGSYPPTGICPSCPTCRPKPPCPSVNCSTSCPNGFLLDANGCKTCKCKCVLIDCAPCPPPQITRIVTNNVTGCATGCRCECPPPPPCAACPYGSDPVQGAVCPTCPVCRPRPTCPVSNCLFIKCASLITETDGNGCTQCRCGCPNVSCATCLTPKISVPIVNPSTNCTTGCNCNCPPLPSCPPCTYGSYPAVDEICPSCPRCRPRPVCPSVYCSKQCQYGYVVDANGCSTCNCTCPPTPRYNPQLCAAARVGFFCRSDADCKGSRCCTGECGGTYCLGD